MLHIYTSKVELASLACTDMASEHRMIERSITNHMNDVIDVETSTFATISPPVKIGGGVVNKDRVITKTFFGIIVLVEFSLTHIIRNLI